MKVILNPDQYVLHFKTSFFIFHLFLEDKWFSNIGRATDFENISNFWELIPSYKKNQLRPKLARKKTELKIHYCFRSLNEIPPPCHQKSLTCCYRLLKKEVFDSNP